MTDLNVFVNIEEWPKGYPEEDSEESFEVLIAIGDVAILVCSLSRELLKKIVSIWSSGGFVEFKNNGLDWYIGVDPGISFLSPEKQMVINPGGGVFISLNEREASSVISSFQKELTELEG